MKFEIFARLTLRGRRWFWRLRAANGRIVASGESSGFHNRTGAYHGVELVMGAGTHTKVQERLR